MSSPSFRAEMQRKRRQKVPRTRFACEHCTSTFKRKEHMVRHRRTHTSEKPYDCAFCESAFTRKDLLVRHERKCAAASSYRNLCESLESSDLQFLGATFPKSDKLNNKGKADETSIGQLVTLPSAQGDPLASNGLLDDFQLPISASDSPSYSESPSNSYAWDLSEIENGYSYTVQPGLVTVPAIAMLSKLTGAEMYGMPSSEEFVQYINAYRDGFAARIPIIHHSTLVSDSSPDMAISVVQVAIAALGAMYFGTLEHGHRLRDLAKNCILILNEGQHEELQYLHLMQARLICSIFDAWSENMKVVETTLDEQPRFERECLRALSSRRERVIVDWKAWVIRESYHRLFWGWFTLMSNLNIIHGGIIRLPMARAYDIALPDSEVAWRETDGGRWRHHVSTSEAPVTLNGGLSGGLDPSYHQEISAYSRFIIQRALLHQSSTIDQVWGIGGVKNVPGSIGMDYLRSICDEQVDKILKNLSMTANQLSLASEVAELETLTQLIRLRRLHLLSPQRRQRLSAFLLDGNMEEAADVFLSRRLTRSKKVTEMMMTCLQYIRTHALHQEKFESIEELLCGWECMLWVRTIEVEYSEGSGIEPGESAVITDISDAVAAKSTKEERGTYLTTRLVFNLGGLLIREKRWGVARPMRQFLDLLSPKL